jgi:hypothetical protein
MEYAAEVACPCAHRLHCEVEGDVHSLRFSDEEAERTTYGERTEYHPGCGEELGLVKLFSASGPTRRGGRHREAAKQVAGTRGPDLLSFDRTSGARSLVRVMSRERERRSRAPDKPPSPSSQPARDPEVKLFGASRAENGPKYAVRLAASAHPDVEMACECSPWVYRQGDTMTLPVLAVRARRWASLVTTSHSRCKECSRSGRLGRLSYRLSSRNRSSVEGEWFW